MKKLKNFSLIVLGALLFVCSSIVFAGCKDNHKNTRLFVFATEGGCVQVNDETDYVEFGDEGEIFKFKQKSKVSLKATANAGYDFVKWEYADNLDKRQEDFSTQPEITLVMDKDEIVIRAVFALNGSIDYNVNYTNDTNKYTIVPENGYANTVLLGGEFKFKVDLAQEYENSNMVVKANGIEVTADANKVYTISNINSDVSITVEVASITIKHTISLPTSEHYTISKTDNSSFGSNTIEVADGEVFEFKVTITHPTEIESFTVKASGNVIAGTSGVYSVEVKQNVTIEIVIVEKVKEITYQFNLSFEPEIAGLIGSDVYNFPQSISFVMLETDSKLEEYDSNEFMVSTSFGENVSIRTLFADIYRELSNLELGFTELKYFEIDGQEFISVDMDGIMHINWTLASHSSVNQITMVIE